MTTLMSGGSGLVASPSFGTMVPVGPIRRNRMGGRSAWPSWCPSMSSIHFWIVSQSADSGGGTACPAPSGRLAGRASSVTGLPPRINSTFSLAPLAASIA